MKELRGLPGSDGDDARVVAFLERFLGDRRQGKLQKFEDYLALFPSCEAEIAAQFDRLSEADAEAEPVERLGRYEIHELLGRGGQGAVYRARDRILKRDVALKVLRHAAMAPKDLLARFRREAVVASRLDHPAICPVYEMDMADGACFIAMQRVTGESLAEKLSRRRADSDPDASTVQRLQPVSADGDAFDRALGSSSRESIELILSYFESAARGLVAAHDAGVVHRDVKPGNLMVDSMGRPVILDFGLARDLSEGAVSLTSSSDFFGTPAYMSPQQVAGERGDASCDVYALGVALFEALTLRRPYRASGRESLLQAIQTQSPIPLRRLNRGVSTELAKVLETVLEKEPRRRYSSAEVFAQELGRVVEGRPVLARGVGQLRKTLRWAKRNPAAIVVMICLVLTTLVSAWMTLDAREAEAKERWQSYVASISGAQLALRDNAAETRRLLASTPAEYRGWEEDWLRRQADGSDDVHQLPGTPQAIRLGTESIEVLLVDGAVVALSREAVSIRPGFERCEASDWDDAGDVSFITDDGQVFGPSAKPLPPAPFSGSSVGAELFCAGNGELLLMEPPLYFRAVRPRSLWRLKPGAQAWETLQHPLSTIRALSWSSATKTLCMGGIGFEMHSIMAWVSPKFSGSRTLNAQKVKALATNGDLIYALVRPEAIDQDDLLVVAHLKSGEVITTRRFPRERVTKVWVENALVVLGFRDGGLALLDQGLGTIHRRLEGHNAEVQDVAINASGQQLLSASVDGELRFWSLGHANDVEVGDLPKSERWWPLLSEDGRSLEFRIKGVGASRFDLLSEEIHALYGSFPLCEEIAPSDRRIYDIGRAIPYRQELSPDRRLVHILTDAWSSDVFSVKTKELILRVPHRLQPKAVSLADGPRLAVLHDESVEIWTPEGCVERIPAPRSSAIAQTLDGRRVAVGFDDGRIELLNVPGGDRMELQAHGGTVTALCFDRRGHRLASAGADQQVFLHGFEHAKAGRLLQLPTNRSVVCHLVFTEDSQALVGFTRSSTSVLRWWAKRPSTREGAAIDVFLHGDDDPSGSRAQSSSKLRAPRLNRVCALSDRRSLEELSAALNGELRWRRQAALIFLGRAEAIDESDWGLVQGRKAQLLAIADLLAGRQFEHPELGESPSEEARRRDRLIHALSKAGSAAFEMLERARGIMVKAGTREHAIQFLGRLELERSERQILEALIAYRNPSADLHRFELRVLFDCEDASLDEWRGAQRKAERLFEISQQHEDAVYAAVCALRVGDARRCLELVEPLVNPRGIIEDRWRTCALALKGLAARAEGDDVNERRYRTETKVWLWRPALARHELARKLGAELGALED